MRQRNKRCGPNLAPTERFILGFFRDTRGHASNGPGSYCCNKDGEDRSDQRRQENLGDHPFPQHARGACCRKNSPHHSSNKRMGGRRRDAVQPGNEVPHDPADKPGKNNFEGNDVGVNNSLRDRCSHCEGEERSHEVQHCRQCDRNFGAQGPGGNGCGHGVARVVEAVREIEGERCCYDKDEECHLVHGFYGARGCPVGKRSLVTLPRLFILCSL